MAISDEPAFQPHPHRGWLAVGVMIATIMIILDKTIVNVALPHMAGSLGASPEQITWVLTSYIVVEAMIIPISGYLARRFGRRNVMLFSVAGFVAASVLCSQATSLQEIILFRLIQGMAGASVIPLSQSIMVDAFEPEQRGRAMAFWGMGIMVGPVMGPILGGYLTSSFDWPWVFLINLPVGVVTLLLLAAYLRDTPRGSGKVDVPGALILALGIGALQIMLDKGNTDDWFQSRFITASAVLGVAMVAWFVVRSLRRDDSVVDIRLLGDRNLAIACTIMFVFGFGMFGTLSILPLFLESLLNYPAADAGLILAPQGVVSLISLGLYGWLHNKLPTRVFVLSGMIFSALGAWMLSGVSMQAGPWNFVPAISVMGFGMGFFFVAISTLAYATLPRSASTEAAGIYNLARTLGQSIGISIAATLQSRYAQAQWETMGSHINPFNPALKDWLAAQGLSLTDPTAPALLGQLLSQQSLTAAFLQVFGVIALSFVGLIPLALMARGVPVDRRSHGH